MLRVVLCSALALSSQQLYASAGNEVGEDLVPTSSAPDQATVVVSELERIIAELEILLERLRLRSKSEYRRESDKELLEEIRVHVEETQDWLGKKLEECHTPADLAELIASRPDLLPPLDEEILIPLRHCSVESGRDFTCIDNDLWAVRLCNWFMRQNNSGDHSLFTCCMYPAAVLLAAIASIPAQGVMCLCSLCLRKKRVLLDDYSACIKFLVSWIECLNRWKPILAGYFESLPSRQSPQECCPRPS